MATSMFAKARKRLRQAAKHLEIDPDVLEKLKYPQETLAASLMVRMDDGSRRSFKAWRCRYDDTRGPTAHLKVIQKARVITSSILTLG